MGRTCVVLCVLLAGGCETVFGIKEVHEGDGGVPSGIALETSEAQHQGSGMIPTLLVPFRKQPSAHDLIVVFVAYWHNIPNLVTDTAQNTYSMVPATGHSPGGSNVVIYYAYDIATAVPFTVTVQTTPASGPDIGKDELTVIAHAYSGTATTDGRDATNTAMGDSSGTVPVPEDCGMLAAASDEVLVSALTRDFNGMPTPATGWKIENDVDFDFMQYMVLTTADRFAGPETAHPMFSNQHSAGGYSWACLSAGFR